MGVLRWLLPSVLATALWSTPAEAAGTHFVLELTTGLGESAYLHESPGLTAGVSFGTSFKLSFLPVRWYVLANLAGRNAYTRGDLAGIDYNLDRRELDVYLSQRLVVPIYGYLRAYGEVGLGQRFTTQTLSRGQALGSLSETQNSLLLVAALGVQARFHENFSIGLRGEVAPLAGPADLAAVAAEVYPTPNRIALLAQLGFHF